MNQLNDRFPKDELLRLFGDNAPNLRTPDNADFWTAPLTGPFLHLGALDPTDQSDRTHGFFVQTTATSSATVQTIRAYHGIVEVEDSTRTAYYLDPQRQIELWLLATAKPPLGEDLTAEIVNEIMKDVP